MAWQTELRDGKPTKVPYRPNGRDRARADTPGTWGTRAEAEAGLARLARRHGPSGVGIMLGASLSDPSLALGGIDLDTCRDQTTGELQPWAREVADRFGTYTEVSPSGGGAKLFFLYGAADLPHLRALGIIHGRTWKHPGDSHPPAIELHLSNRYFTVTGERLAEYPAALRMVPLEDLVWLIRDAGPRFLRLVGSPPPPVIEVPDIWMRIEAAAQGSPRLARLLRTDFAELRDRSRSGIAFALTGALRHAGFGREDAFAALRACPKTADWAREKGAAANGRELDRLWERSGNAAAADPPPAPRALYREPPKAQPYPIDCLGPLMAGAVRAVQDCTQAPDAVCAHAVLGVAALAAQPIADVELPTGQRRPASLFLLTIAASGERKSAADHWALGGVREREEKLGARFTDDHATWRNQHDIWKREREKILGDRKLTGQQKEDQLTRLGKEPKPPLHPLIVVNEPTWEGLVKMMPHALPSLGLFSAEGGSFLGGHGMSDDAKARTAAGLSEAWDGVPIKRVRGGDGVTVLPGRRLAAHLMAQPAIAGAFIQDEVLAGAGGQGLVNRFLITQPPSTAGTRMFRKPSADAVATLREWDAIVMDRLAGTWRTRADDAQVLEPRVLPMRDDAAACWVRYHDENEAQLGDGGRLAPIAGFANKLPEHAARIAAVRTLMEDPAADAIPESHMRDAITIARYYANEALRLADAGAAPAHLKEPELVLRWLHDTWKQDLVSLPDIYQRGPYSVRTAAKARAVVAVLVEHGWLVPDAGEVDGKPRREVWRVVPPVPPPGQDLV